MGNQILIGAKAKTLGPLKPTGRISVEGQVIDAASEGTWVDGGVDVVVIGGNVRQAIVRVYDSDNDLPEHAGRPLKDDDPVEAALREPAAWVERIHAVRIGVAIGILLVPVAWMLGTPFNGYAVLVPASCALAGWMFGWFVGKAVETVGPRADHRPQAFLVACFVICASIAGGALGASVGPVFLGLCWGIPAGALIGGALAYVTWIVSNL